LIARISEVGGASHTPKDVLQSPIEEIYDARVAEVFSRVTTRKSDVNTSPVVALFSVVIILGEQRGRHAPKGHQSPTTEHRQRDRAPIAQRVGGCGRNPEHESRHSDYRCLLQHHPLSFSLIPRADQCSNGDPNHRIAPAFIDLRSTARQITQRILHRSDALRRTADGRRRSCPDAIVPARIPVR
jgi:hypothetical protein